MSLTSDIERPAREPGSTLDRWMYYVHEGLHVERLHTVHTIQRQTVADHTAHAQAIAVYLAERNTGMRIGHVLLYLLQHDVAEQYTGDVPADAKIESPELKRSLDTVERKWERERMLGVSLSLHESDLCKMADWLELQRFCIVEREMGNQRILPVYYNITSYIENHPAIRTIEGATDLCQSNKKRWNNITERGF